MGSPPTPPSEVALNSGPLAINTAAKVLNAQSEAIRDLSSYFADTSRQDGPAAWFAYSLGLLKQTVVCGGKIVFSGMGKSHKIGSKLVATLHSFGIPAASLHPSDALHGDMGQVNRKDVVVLVSASGNSPELSALLRHLPDQLLTVCLTCNEHSPLARQSTGIIVAPLNSHLREQELYGLPAPTITTTLCLAIGDAMCIALYESWELDLKTRRANFTRWHPGGAIGQANGIGDAATDELVVVPWASVPQLHTSLAQAKPVDLWRAAALCVYICAADVVFRTADVVHALEKDVPLVDVSGERLELAPQHRGSGLCVFRDENGIPTGVVWD